jgi:glycine cleavage system H lipoate-binding protein
MATNKNNASVQIDGTLATTSVARWCAPVGGRITAVTSAVTTAPTGSALTFSVLNKTNSDASMATVSVAVSSTSGTTTLGSVANRRFDAGDVIEVDLTQVGSTVAGANLNVLFEFDSSDGTAAGSDIYDAENFQVDVYSAAATV